MTSSKPTPTGRWVRSLEGYRCFIPDPLPRRIDIDQSLVYLLDEASRGVATLAGVGETLANPYLLIRPFMRREAVLSSRIEGTQSSLSDVFLYEATKGKRDPGGDAGDVANYVDALEYGLEQLKRLPISVRLVGKLHRRLLAGVRGEEKTPGQLRNRQVWIGEHGTSVEEARFVPAPHDQVRDLLTDWEVFVNEDLRIPPLIQAAVMHYQFEAIHPYLDGNGRIGRLLITLFLCAKGVLPTPLLYLSAYFERNRDAYYDHLLNVSERGTWQAWFQFFLEGAAEQAHDAVLRSRNIRQLQDDFSNRLKAARASGNAFRLVEKLFWNPYLTAPWAAEWLAVTPAGARGILRKLVEVGVLVEVPESWPRLYLSEELLDAIRRPVALSR